MATIKYVARLAGVSVATVSRVINNSPKTSAGSRQAVMQAMEQLQYHPNANARALAQQSTETLGLIVADVSDPFFGAMVKAVEQVAYHTGNFLLIGNSYHILDKECQAIEQLIRHRCAGRSLRRLVGHAPSNPDGASTHRLIFCSSHNIPDSVDRLQGYRDALEKVHIELDEKLIAFGEPDEVGVEQALTELLGHGRNFTAIACYNDSTAAGAMAVLSDNGIEVPQGMSLVGFDDVLISRYLRSV